MAIDRVAQYKELQEFLLTMTTTCYKQCVFDYSQPTLRQQEVECIRNCAVKDMQVQRQMMDVHK